ncbi:uncharacterized protein ACWYII_009314 isoform 1-T1 [Salvelinus alpinus]
MQAMEELGNVQLRRIVCTDPCDMGPCIIKLKHEGGEEESQCEAATFSSWKERTNQDRHISVPPLRSRKYVRRWMSSSMWPMQRQEENMSYRNIRLVPPGYLPGPDPGKDQAGSTRLPSRTRASERW